MHTAPENLPRCPTTVFMDPGLAAAPRPGMTALAGYRIALTVRGKDYVYPGGSGGRLSNFKNELTGCGPFLHDDQRDRPPEVFAGVTALHFGAAVRPYLLLPIIPAKQKRGK